MKICECNLHFYELPMVHSSEPRRGILLSLKNEERQCGWGEIAPLPGWSRETFQEAYNQLQGIHFLDCDFGKFEEMDLYPSVAFGIESALASLKQPLVDLSPLPLSALLMGNANEILKKADLIIKQGYKTAKLKVGQLSIEEAFDIVSELKDKMLLRIDVNRAWTLEQSVKFFSHFSKTDFDYVEEPVDNIEDLIHFEYPFAMDESLRETSVDFFLQFEHLKAFIFKPTLSGGFSECLKMKKSGKDIVLSSAFESGVGIYHIASFIERLSLPKLPLGLDTYRFLQKDILETPLDFSTSCLILPSTINVKT
ncbi:MAG TPA: o-succinylbenzoate synthase [Rhabdochlamydiaceae bacterium]|nr:o-succinylbenzoate synthase [Rhabdochlamydiaceae bacterium]